MTTTLTARDLTKIYRSGEVEVHALRGADLDLYEGDVLMQIGDPEDLEIVSDYLSMDAVRIEAGDRVIVHPGDRVTDGARIASRG